MPSRGQPQRGRICARYAKADGFVISTSSGICGRPNPSSGWPARKRRKTVVYVHLTLPICQSGLPCLEWMRAPRERRAIRDFIDERRRSTLRPGVSRWCPWDERSIPHQRWAISRTRSSTGSYWYRGARRTLCAFLRTVKRAPNRAEYP